MKKFILFFLFVASACLVQAQKVYFVYVQTEAATPFFVKMGDKVLSSTSQGYIIIPSLRDSSYTLTIGIPGVAEKKFKVTIHHKDRGFLLKDFNGNWGLFDLQSMEITNAEADEKKPEPMAIRSDEFSKKLALAVDDPSLLFVYAKAEPAPVLVKKDDPVTPATSTSAEATQAASITSNSAEKANDSIIQTVATSNTDPAVVADSTLKKDTEILTDIAARVVETKDTTAADDPSKNEIQTGLENSMVDHGVKKDTIASTAGNQPQLNEEKDIAQPKAYKLSKVTRRSESSTTEGFGLVFLDEQDGKVDTIRILIPNPPVVYKTEADIKREQELIAGNTEVKKEVTAVPDQKEVAADTPVNPACPDLATEADFKKLRKDMVSKDNDEDMIDRARKVFKTKCFSTAQVKLLGALFLTPGGRYGFFDAAYGHVSDPQEFSSLRSELSNDEYYLRRFKALIGEQ